MSDSTSTNEDSVRYVLSVLSWVKSKVETKNEMIFVFTKNTEAVRSFVLIFKWNCRSIFPCICGRNFEARRCGALQNKAHALTGMETLAFIILPAPIGICFRLKRSCTQSRVYPEVGYLR